MNNSKKKGLTLILISLSILISVTSCGMFVLSVERNKKRDTARQIIKHENDIKKLRRDNEELSAKIAEKESFAYLSTRTNITLTQPTESEVVWAYENYQGGRVNLSQRDRGYISFKIADEDNVHQ